ncbi:metabolite traffic protein EboE [Nonomuraea sp. NN258]|uniref:metabolite traffic protein EboE n=1 Tax=Nonomuraea antri TaxID=2730852 RepID=UPI001569CB40|nr:metabolite traffic protein EboE [Nonomuraea antri]NRQ37242.1 metabolite traffic protein EboE [Nonomuraea antri]
MRFGHADGSIVHLAYCTNVHPAEDLPGIHAQLAGPCARVRALLGAERLGVGLWLSRGVAATLAADAAELAGLRTALDRLGLEVVTLNGFPYQGFQQEVVKYRVYEPDWGTPERLRYTLDLADVLAGLLPADVGEGTISTLPLTWRTAWSPDTAVAVSQQLAALAAGLRERAERTGKVIRVGFEPEPGCVVETTGQARALLPLGVAGHELLGVCLDACHLAVGFEEPPDLTLPIVKLQASCALESPPGAQAELARFDERRFLHQTRSASGFTDDLGEALAGALPAEETWRVHFHLPLHAELPPPLTTTRGYLRRLLAALLAGPAPLTRHVEVETYTWSVMPGERRDVAECVAAELDWTRRELVALGLKEL